MLAITSLALMVVVPLGGAAAEAVGNAPASSCPTVDPATGAVSPAPGPGVSWQGCDLSGASMSGANLYSANLGSANLTGAKLRSADLTDANLSNANLSNADLRQAMLSGTVLTGATMTGVSSGYISGTPVSLPTGWSLASNYLVGPGANLEDANLAAADLTNQDLTGANLTDAALAHSIISGASLSGATLTGLSSGQLTGTPASLPANWVLSNGYLVGPSGNLGGADLAGQNLANLTLNGIDLNGALLSGTDLSGSNLTGAVMDNANLTGTDLASATLTGVHSGGITGTPASLPASWTLVSGHLIGPGADMQGSDLFQLDLANADLQGANLSSADLTQTDLAGTNLTDANLANDQMYGTNLNSGNLTGAILTGVILSGAYLTGANLTGVNLTGAYVTRVSLANANLAGAKLARVSSSSNTGTPAALPRHWTYQGGYLIGPLANLYQANMSRFVLIGADLAGAELGDAGLTHANLTGANLAGADLNVADVAYSNLSHADLAHATVLATNFNGVLWTDAICPNGSTSGPAGCYPYPTAPGWKSSLISFPGRDGRGVALSCASEQQCAAAGQYVTTSVPPNETGVLLGWTTAKGWTSVPPRTPAANNGVTVSAMSCPTVSSCFAGGSYLARTGGGVPLLLRWSAGKWSAANAPQPAGASGADIGAVSCPGTTWCTAVGVYDDSAGHVHGLLLRLSGSTWTAATAPVPADAAAASTSMTLGAVSCPSTSRCIAVGSYQGADGLTKPMVLTWSAGKWTASKAQLPSGAAADPQPSINAVSCSSARCAAVGTYVDTAGRHQGVILNWSAGSAWTALRAPLPRGTWPDPRVGLQAVSCPSGSACFAIGGYSDSREVLFGVLLTWSGGAWKATRMPTSFASAASMSCVGTTRCFALAGKDMLIGP